MAGSIANFLCSFVVLFDIILIFKPDDTKQNKYYCNTNKTKFHYRQRIHEMRFGEIGFDEMVFGEMDLNLLGNLLIFY